MAAACPTSEDTSITALTSSVHDLASALPKAETSFEWRALRVRPRWEKLVAATIDGKEYESFLPVYKKRSQWSDRVKELEVPLFPGYVFLRGDFSRKSKVVTSPGVIGILSFGGVPATVSKDEIQALKAVIASGLYAEPWQYVREGERVRLCTGPLTGLEGILIRAKGECRVVLSVETLCRSIAVEVNRDSIAPLSWSSQSSSRA